MSVSQAIFGAVGKGHSLIAASPGATALAPRIVGRTDLPNTAPPGVQWTQYESLFVHDGHLCVLRTWPDATAERAGMVFTHALLMPWTEAATMGDLAALAGLLPSTPARATSLNDVTITAPPPAGDPNDHALMLMDAMLGGDDANPIVWLGDTGLLEAVAVIWRFLPANLRKALSLRISFGPDDIHANPPRFVSTPRSLAARWQGRAVIDPAMPAAATSEVTRSLMLDAPAQSIGAYAERFEVDVKSIRELALLQQSWSLSQTTPRSFSSTLGELRLLLRLAPRVDRATSAKHDVVRLLADAISSATADEVLRLRNVDVDDWGADDFLWPPVEAWAQNDAVKPHDFGLWSTAAGATARPQWTGAIWRGFARAFKSPTADQCNAWWTAWTMDAALAVTAIDRLPRSNKVETALARTYPAAAPAAFAAAIMDAARTKGWLLLHAQAARTMPRVEAVDAQLAIDRDATHGEALDVLMADASPSEAVAMAIRFPDQRLITHAGQACATTPAAMADFDNSNPTWRKILVGAAAENPAVFDGLRDLGALRAQLVALFAASSTLEPEFLEAVGSSSLADLTELPNLENLWTQIPGDARPQFVQRTAEAWLAKFAKGDADPSGLGATLRRAIVGDALRDRFLFGSTASPAGAIRYFEAFDEIRAETVLRWLQHLHQQKTDLDRPLAEQLGRLVRQRHWYGAASAITQHVCIRNWRSVAPAIPALRPILGPLDLTLLFMTGASPGSPTADEVWSAFEHIAAELYPEGPNDDELWSRAGGKVSKLPGGKTGAARWHATINLLKRGGASITGRKLLREMLRDRSRNEHLQWLAKQNWLGD